MLDRDTSILLEVNERLAYPGALYKFYHKADFDTGLPYKQKKFDPRCIGSTIYVLHVEKVLSTLSDATLKSYSWI